MEKHLPMDQTLNLRPSVLATKIIPPTPQKINEKLNCGAGGVPRL